MHVFIIWLNQYIEHVEQFIQKQSVLAPLLLLFIEEAGVPIFVPGDGVLAYTGFSVQAAHQTSLWLAFSVALCAVILGSSILFFISKRYGQTLITKLGKFIFLKENHLKRAEQLFKRYGVWTIIFGRHIPGMRIPITIFAAISGISYRTFILSTLTSTLLWIWFYLSVGKRYGADLQQLIQRSTGVTIGVIIGIVVIIVGLHLVGLYREKHAK